MNYKYLLFDLDNTLLSFDLSEAFALRKTFMDLKIDYTPKVQETYHRINKWCWMQFEENKMTLAELKPRRMELTLEELKLVRDPYRMSESYHDNLAQTTFWVEGAKELIESLHGKYELVLITNGIESVQLPRLKNTGLGQYFPTVVISESIGISKPNAGFFDYTFEQIQHPPKEQVLVIGDSLSSDIRGGHDYGLDTCWHNFKGIENKRGVKPTYEIQKIGELRSILTSM